MYAWNLNISTVNAWRLRMLVKIYFFYKKTSNKWDKILWNKLHLFFHRPQATRSPSWTSCGSWSWSCLASMAPCPSGGGSAAAPLTRRDLTAWATGLCQRRTSGKPKRRNCKQCTVVGKLNVKALLMCAKCKVPLHHHCIKERNSMPLILLLYFFHIFVTSIHLIIKSLFCPFFHNLFSNVKVIQ